MKASVYLTYIYWILATLLMELLFSLAISLEWQDLPFLLVNEQCIGLSANEMRHFFFDSIVVIYFFPVSFSLLILATFRLCSKAGFRIVRLFPPFYFIEEESMLNVPPFTSFLSL